jgi:DNA-binding transcriptional MerR regulator
MVNGEPPGLSQAALGRALNLSPPAITKLKKLGMPVDSIEAAQAWRQSRQNIAQRKPEPEHLRLVPAAGFVLPANDESHDQARTRREIAEANLAELKLAELEGRLVRAEDVRAGLAKRYASLRESLLQMPARVVPLLAANPDPGAMDRLLRAEIVAALAQLTEK